MAPKDSPIVQRHKAYKTRKPFQKPVFQKTVKNESLMSLQDSKQQSPRARAAFPDIGYPENSVQDSTRRLRGNLVENSVMMSEQPSIYETPLQTVTAANKGVFAPTLINIRASRGVKKSTRRNNSANSPDSHRFRAKYAVRAS